jgi:hypothetical protein
MQAGELLGIEVLVFTVLCIYLILAGELESMRYTRLEDVLFRELIIAHPVAFVLLAIRCICMRIPNHTVSRFRLFHLCSKREQTYSVQSLEWGVGYSCHESGSPLSIYMYADRFFSTSDL